ncbi:integration host factor subunit beta [Candidatus Pacearchaeota archaeon]|nr:MAG: integration host factor subunit beta [Candidatus Pacearchaeota archaeon]
MRKADIIREVAKKVGVPQTQTKAIIDTFLETIKEKTVKEGRVDLRGFGIFKKVKRKAKKARNIRTGETITVPEREVVVFKPSAKFKPGKM